MKTCLFFYIFLVLTTLVSNLHAATEPSINTLANEEKQPLIPSDRKIGLGQKLLSIMCPCYKTSPTEESIEHNSTKPDGQITISDACNPNEQPSLITNMNYDGNEPPK